MAITIPNVAEVNLLDRLLDKVETWYHLYVNSIVLGPATVKTDFVEGSWPGYAAKKVTTWTPAITVSGRAESSADQQQWIRTFDGSGQLVYGYYVTDGQTGPLLWCETRAAGPIRMQFSSDTVTVMPRVTLREDPNPE